MQVLIIQNEKRCAETLVSLLEQQIPTLNREHIALLCIDEGIDENTILNFITEYERLIRVIILDVHLRLPLISKYNLYGGLRIYHQIVKRGLHHIRLLLTSYDSVSNYLTLDDNCRVFFESEWLQVNPHIRLPFVIEHLVPIILELFQTSMEDME